MPDKDDDEYLSAGEQFAFSEARDVALRYVFEDYPARDVGQGILIAALVAFRKTLTDTEISTILYQFADDHAVPSRG
jgi:hypothetical protein